MFIARFQHVDSIFAAILVACQQSLSHRRLCRFAVPGLELSRRTANHSTFSATDDAPSLVEHRREAALATELDGLKRTLKEQKYKPS